MGKYAKRFYDLAFATVGLVVLSLSLLLIAVAVKLGDGGPVFFHQKRVGYRGRPFSIMKFRSMSVGAENQGPKVTRVGDARITRVGKILRRFKLDELPQLWNVLKGEMSFVGPRPEVPRYVDQYTEKQRRVLELKPGITDPATLAFRDEGELLRGVSDVEAFYVEYCMPRKIELNLDYSQRANLWNDTKIIFATVLPFCRRPAMTEKLCAKE